MLTDASNPEDLVLVGYIAGAYGVKGWVRVRPYSQDADALLAAKTWWLDRPRLHDVSVMQSRLHVDEVVAQLMGVADRDAAEALKGAAVQIRRSHFPALGQDEYYWVDLIGLAVENLRGEPLGSIKDLMDNGAHPILVVQAAPADGEDKPRQMLIPFVDRFVHKVDQTEKRVVVDWERDY